MEIQTKNIIAGNQQAFYSFFEAYHFKLYQYVYKYTQSDYYAEETVQLAFIRLWEKREKLYEQYSLSVQLFRMAKSILIDLMRREKIRDTQELSDTFITMHPEDERIIYKDELEHVLAAIEELPAQCRQVFKLSRFNELSHNEISAQLSISPKTIETHITKALKYLRKTISVFF